MEYIFELVLELFVEGGMEIGKNKKISKWIRYPILALIILFFAAIIFLLLFLGIVLINENVLAAIIILGLGITALVGIIFKCRKMYLELKSK